MGSFSERRDAPPAETEPKVDLRTYIEQVKSQMNIVAAEEITQALSQEGEIPYTYQTRGQMLKQWQEMPNGTGSLANWDDNSFVVYYKDAQGACVELILDPKKIELPKPNFSGRPEEPVWKRLEGGIKGLGFKLNRFGEVLFYQHIRMDVDRFKKGEPPVKEPEPNEKWQPQPEKKFDL